MKGFTKSENSILHVVLDKTEYDEEEVISVNIQLLPDKPIFISRLEVTLRCEEVVERRDAEGSAVHNTHPLVEETVPLVTSAAGKREFEAKKHNFYARFVLSAGLIRVKYETRNHLKVYISHYIEAALWPSTNTKKPELTARRFFQVTALDQQIPRLPITTNYTCAGEGAVRFLGMATTSHCTVEVELDRPGLLVDGITTASIHIFSPRPKATIKIMQLVVLEDYFFHHERLQESRPAMRWEMPLEKLIEDTEATAGCRLQWIKPLRITPGCLHHSIQLHLMTITHRLMLIVRFHRGLSAKILLDQITVIQK